MKKDDIPLPQLPKLPSSMGEMWEMAGELGKSATSLISGVQQSEVPAKPLSKEVMSSANQTTLLPPNEIDLSGKEEFHLESGLFGFHRVH